MTYNLDILDRISANDPTLTHVGFETETTLDGEYLEKLKESLDQNTHVTTLVFLHNYINDDTAQIISRIRCASLRHISLQNNQISDEGAIAIASMSLDSINMSYNFIHNKGAVAFAHHDSLNELDISFNQIGNQGLIALLLNKTINNLNVEGNQFDMESLKQVFSNTTLTKFKCRNKHVSSEFNTKQIQPHIQKNSFNRDKDVNTYSWRHFVAHMMWSPSALMLGSKKNEHPNKPPQVNL